MKVRIIFILLSWSIKMFSIDPDKIIGTYWSPDKDGKISIYKKNGKYYGKSIESKTPKLRDVNNPNPALRDRIVLGTDVFFDFVFEGDEYVNGTIYNPLDGKTYSSKMWLEGNNLKLRGYIGIPILGVTKTMEKIN